MKKKGNIYERMAQFNNAEELIFVLVKRYGSTLMRTKFLPLTDEMTSVIEKEGKFNFGFDFTEALTFRFQQNGINTIFFATWDLDESDRIIGMYVVGYEKDVYEIATKVVTNFLDDHLVAQELSAENSKKVRRWGVQTFIEYILRQIDVQIAPDDLAEPVYDMTIKSIDVKEKGDHVNIYITPGLND